MRFFSIPNFTIALTCMALSACSGSNAPKSTGTDTTTTNTSGVTAPAPAAAPAAPAAPTDSTKLAEHAKGTRKKPNKLSSTKDMLPYHFYDIAGYKVCQAGTAPLDSNKRYVFVNVVGPAEECPSDPKKTFTLILRKQIVTNKSLFFNAGQKIEKGIVVPQRDVGNDRLVVFISDDVASNQFKFGS